MWIDQGGNRGSAYVAYQAKGRVVLAPPSSSLYSNFLHLSCADHVLDKFSYRNPFRGHLSASLPGYVNHAWRGFHSRPTWLSNPR